MKCRLLAYLDDWNIFDKKLIMEFETFEQALAYVREYQEYFSNWGIANMENQIFMAVMYRPIPKCGTASVTGDHK